MLYLGALLKWEHCCNRRNDNASNYVLNVAHHHPYPHLRIHRPQGIAFHFRLSATVQRTQGLDVDISAVTARVNIHRFTTERLQEWLEDNGPHLQVNGRDAVRESPEVCDLLVAALRNVISRAQRERKRSGFLKRFVFVVFSQPNLERYSNSLNDQVLALNMLLQTFSMYIYHFCPFFNSSMGVFLTCPVQRGYCGRLWVPTRPRLFTKV